MSYAEQQDRWIVLVDIEGYSKRRGSDQVELHRRLDEVLDRALDRVVTKPGVDRGLRQDRGDGALLLLPLDTKPVQLIRELTRGLVDELDQHNRMYSAELEMRLRVGINHGMVTIDGARWNSDEINDLARLVEAEPVRELLARARRSPMVLVVSEVVHRRVVRGAHPGIDPAAYGRVPFLTKHHEELVAWVMAPGYPAPPELASVLARAGAATGGVEAAAGSAEAGADRGAGAGEPAPRSSGVPDDSGGRDGVGRAEVGVDARFGGVGTVKGDMKVINVILGGEGQL